MLIGSAFCVLLVVVSVSANTYCTGTQGKHCSTNNDLCIQSLVNESSCITKGVETLENKEIKLRARLNKIRKSLTLNTKKIRKEQITMTENLKRFKRDQNVIADRTSKALGDLDKRMKKSDLQNTLCIRKQVRTETVVFREIAMFRIVQEEEKIKAEKLKDELKTMVNESANKISRHIAAGEKKFVVINQAIQGKFAKLDDKMAEFSKAEARIIQKMKEKLSLVFARLKALDLHVSSLHQKQTALGKKVTNVENRIKTLTTNVNNNKVKINNKICQDGSIWLGRVWGTASRYTKVRFSRHFSATPRITYGLTHIDANSTVRIKTWLSNKSRKGFTVNLKTWLGSRVHGIRIHWMACT